MSFWSFFLVCICNREFLLTEKKKLEKKLEKISRSVSVSEARRKQGSVQRRPWPQKTPMYKQPTPHIYVWYVLQQTTPFFFSSHAFSIQINGPETQPESP